jgi:hypothetical protein
MPLVAILCCCHWRLAASLCPEPQAIVTIKAPTIDLASGIAHQPINSWRL